MGESGSSVTISVLFPTIDGQARTKFVSEIRTLALLENGFAVDGPWHVYIQILVFGLPAQALLCTLRP